jgi:hypothetical protein
MLPKMLEHDRRQAGWSVGQAAWRLGVSVREYRELGAGDRPPSFDTWTGSRMAGSEQPVRAGAARV